jgi:hypothetical protein
MDTSDHGLLYPFKGAGAAMNGLKSVNKYVGEVSLFLVATDCIKSVRHR